LPDDPARLIPHFVYRGGLLPHLNLPALKGHLKPYTLPLPRFLPSQHSCPRLPCLARNVGHVVVFQPFAFPFFDPFFTQRLNFFACGLPPSGRLCPGLSGRVPLLCTFSTALVVLYSSVCCCRLQATPSCFLFAGSVHSRLLPRGVVPSDRCILLTLDHFASVPELDFALPVPKLSTLSGYLDFLFSIVAPSFRCCYPDCPAPIRPLTHSCRRTLKKHKEHPAFPFSPSFVHCCSKEDAFFLCLHFPSLPPSFLLFMMCAVTRAHPHCCSRGRNTPIGKLCHCYPPWHRVAK